MTVNAFKPGTPSPTQLASISVHNQQLPSAFGFFGTALLQNIYLWVNVYKTGKEYYQKRELERIEKIDFYFGFNLTYYQSQGKTCHTGTRVIFVDGRGIIYRCPFVSTPIGSIRKSWKEQEFIDTPCPNQTCHCHIGYVHMPHLEMENIFSDGLLERVPKHILFNKS